MTSQDERISTIVLNHFRKSGTSIANTGIFADVSSEVRTFVKSNVELSNQELVLIAGMLSPTRWTVLSSRRLFVAEEGGLQVVPWEEIDEVIVDFSGIEYSLEAKSQLSEAKVTTKSGEELLVKTAPGQPFIAFWNCLKLAKQMGVEEARRRGKGE